MLQTLLKTQQRLSARANGLAAAGFTLIEVVVVVAIVSILAAMMAPLLSQQIDQARATATQDHLERVAKALRNYHLDVYDFPVSTGNATTDIGQLETSTVAAWNGPYLTARYDPGDYAQDAWGTVMNYTHTAGTPTALLVAAGIDHQIGTADDISLTVVMDLESVQKRVRATEKRLTYISGEIYGANPSLSPATYTIPALWLADAWGNNNIYVHNNDSLAVVYSWGVDGTGTTTGPTGDDIFVPMVWNPPGGGGSSGGSSGSGGSASDSLTLVAGTVSSCSGGKKIGFKFHNSGTEDVQITQMQITWSGGSALKRIQGQSGSGQCGDGNTLWDKEDCGVPTNSQSSPATITSFCSSINVSSGADYYIGELKFEDSVSGNSVTVVLTHQPSGGGASTSTITFTAP